KQRILDALHLWLAHLDVELQTANAREIELARSEKHAFEQAISSLHGRRIARAHFAINLEQRIDGLGDRVFLQGLGNHDPNVIAFGEESRKLLDAGLNDLL